MASGTTPSSLNAHNINRKLFKLFFNGSLRDRQRHHRQRDRHRLPIQQRHRPRDRHQPGPTLTQTNYDTAVPRPEENNSITGDQDSTTYEFANTTTSDTGSNQGLSGSTSTTTGTSTTNYTGNSITGDFRAARCPARRQQRPRKQETTLGAVSPGQR